MVRSKKKNHKEEDVENPPIPTETSEVEEVISTEQQMAMEIEQWKDKYMRCMADFDNFRRRTNQEKQEWSFYAKEKMILSVCDVIDNFERASQLIPEEHQEDAYLKGLLQIQTQLANVLQKENVEKIEALHAEFDPALHEALAHIPSELEENRIVAVIQNGYKIQSKVIRPARVAVSNGNSPLEENINKDNNGGSNG